MSATSLAAINIALTETNGNCHLQIFFQKYCFTIHSILDSREKLNRKKCSGLENVSVLDRKIYYPKR